jgi:hypothetical protein
MELSPIPGIRAMGPATVSRDEREVRPPFALNASGRMSEDAYSGAREETERGLEDESDEAVEEVDSVLDSLSSTSDSKSRVNFFA